MNPVCFALDVPNPADADRFVELLTPHVGAFKVGLELFIASHRQGWWPKTSLPVVLDLKLHDIPETVARAVRAGGDLGVKYMTLHVQQRQALELGVRAAEPYGITLLGVTALTSMTMRDASDLDLEGAIDLRYRIIRLARFGYDCGLRGFVSSPQEVLDLRDRFQDAFLLVPGIRPTGSDPGDQKRVGTPAQAVADGANLIVVGRPIRDAADPVAAAIAIQSEIQGRP